MSGQQLSPFTSYQYFLSSVGGHSQAPVYLRGVALQRQVLPRVRQSSTSQLVLMRNQAVLLPSPGTASLHARCEGNAQSLQQPVPSQGRAPLICPALAPSAPSQPRATLVLRAQGGTASQWDETNCFSQPLDMLLSSNQPSFGPHDAS